MIIKPENILVDGKKIGDVLEFHLTYAADNENERKATIKYTVSGKERILTCSLEAVSFES